MAVGSATLRRLAALGLSPQAMAEVLSIIADIEAPHEERRAKDAARKRGKSDEIPRNIPGLSAENPPPHAGARAEPTKLILPVPPQESQKEEDSAPASPQRGKHLVPDGFAPSPETIATARKNWGYAEAQVLERAEAMREWSRGKGEKRLNWDLVLLGFLRRDARDNRGGRGPPRDKILTGIPRALAELEGRLNPDGTERNDDDDEAGDGGGGGEIAAEAARGVVIEPDREPSLFPQPDPRPATRHRLG